MWTSAFLYRADQEEDEHSCLTTWMGQEPLQLHSLSIKVHAREGNLREGEEIQNMVFWLLTSLKRVVNNSNMRYLEVLLDITLCLFVVIKSGKLFNIFNEYFLPPEDINLTYPICILTYFLS